MKNDQKGLDLGQPVKKGRPRKFVQGLDAKVVPDESLEKTIEKHRLIVARSRDLYEASIKSGESASAGAKYQQNYNQALKTLVMLEEEAERRAVSRRELISAREASELMMSREGRFVELLDSLPSECGERCNPDSPTVAIGVLEAWKHNARIALSKQSAST